MPDPLFFLIARLNNACSPHVINLQINPDYLIWVSNGHTFDFLLKPFFLGYSRGKSITDFFLNLRVPPISVNNLKWLTKFQIYQLDILDSDWLNFYHFSGYKYKIRLVLILRKREDHALISISTILKFSAQITLLFSYCYM